ncbi:MAG: GntP family permease [Bacteroidales bacterium]|nr:GntP family permease [Bacteroidales bacterium]MBQ1929613.1 GntP family permease [Bacteroidales bacterium]MBQ5784231.1 GntP family permease [Bacteroidales bacterium]
MLTGTALIVVFVLAIVLLILLVSKWNVHPFLAIMGIALVLAIGIGIPLETIPTTIGKGFSSIFTSIGIVIILGTIIGLILEKTGAAIRLADAIIRVIGEKHPQLAVMLIGWIISVPVFCDSGFVIVNPIRKWLARKTKFSSVTLTVALSAGLYVAHVFIPPTPGPIATAGLVGLENNLLLVIGMGVAVSIVPLIAAYFFATYIGRKVKSTDELDVESISQAYNQHNLPSTFASVLPILLPIILMAGGSVASLVKMEGYVGTLLVFLGKPIIALAMGLVCALPLLWRQKMGKDLYNITQDSLKTAGPIIFITAAGSVLGQIIVEAGFVGYIKENASSLSSIGLFFPFVIAAILKSSQGSSTVAMTTTAGIMGLYFSDASLMTALGMTTPLDAAMVVMAIGAGAMTVSHANDSYFWVVTNFGGLTPQNGYKTQTALTFILGVTSIITLFVISLFV